MSATALVALLLALGHLEVAGRATCPSPAEVSRHLGELGPATSGVVVAHDAGAARVVLSRSATALRLVLLGPNANELATRELPAEGTCNDLAAAAAVVVAAWRADLDPELTPAVRLPLEATVPSLPPTVVAEAPPPESARSYRLGLGLMASETGGNFAPGAVLTGAVGLGAGPFALEASLLGTTSRSTDAGALAGAASWTRVTLALGPALDLGRGTTRGELHAQGLLGVLRVKGVGVPNAASDTSPQAGVMLGGKLEIVTGSSVAWVGLDGLAWPGDQHLVIQNDAADSGGRLPWLEVVASLGLGLGRFP